MELKAGGCGWPAGEGTDAVVSWSYGNSIRFAGPPSGAGRAMTNPKIKTVAKARHLICGDRERISVQFN